MDIEEVAAATPEKILSFSVDPATGYQPFHGRRVAFALGLEGAAVKQCVRPQVIGLPGCPDVERSELVGVRCRGWRCVHRLPLAVVNLFRERLSVLVVDRRDFRLCNTPSPPYVSSCRGRHDERDDERDGERDGANTHPETAEQKSEPETWASLQEHPR